MKPLLQDDLPAQSYGRLLLLPGAKPPVPVVSRGRQVCTCFDVGVSQIETTLGSYDGDVDARFTRPAGRSEMRHQLRQLYSGTEKADQDACLSRVSWTCGSTGVPVT